MTKEETRRALIALDDDDVRERVVAGNVSVLAAYELTHAERKLVVDAVSDWPEVAGFMFEVFSTSGGDGDPWNPAELKIDKPKPWSKHQAAVDYVRGPEPHI